MSPFFFCYIFHVFHIFFLQDSEDNFPTSTYSAMSTLSTATAATSNSSFRDELISALQIPVRLTERSDRSDLHLAYEKYLGYLQAVVTLDQMVAAGTWPSKKPSSTDIVECFVSKTMWFTYYRPAFSKVARYPVMVKWLENEIDPPSGLEAWGLEKSTYTFKDLMEFVSNDGVLEEAKDMGKRKAKSDGKGREKLATKKITKKRRMS